MEIKRNMSDELFKAHHRKPVRFAGKSQGIPAIGQKAAYGEAYSAVRTAQENAPVTINAILIAVQEITDGKVAGVKLTNGSECNIYFEYENYSVVTRDDGCVVLAGAQDNARVISHIALLSSLFNAICQTGYETTKKDFSELISAIRNSDDETIRDNAIRFADSFYYEFYKANSQNKEFLFTDYLSPLEEHLAAPVWQAVCTAKAESITIADPYVSADVKNPNAKVNLEDSEKAESRTDIFDSCRLGDYVLDYHWQEFRRKYIQNLSMLDDFVPSETFYTMVNLIDHEIKEVMKRKAEKGFDGIKAIGDNYVNVQFVGKPGTGKTTLAEALSATFGMPVRTITHSKGTEEDTYEGKTKVMNGGFQFVETPFLDVYKNGGIILLEEYNLADPAVTMGALGQALEKPFILMEDGYKEVRRHEMCIVIATMNSNTQGSREPSEAFTSRLPHVFVLDDPQEEEFVSILAKRTGSEEKLCKKVYKDYEKILAYLCSPAVNMEDVAASLTLRHCIAALKQLEIGVSYKNAIKNTMVGTIAIKDMALAKEVMENVVDSFINV